MQILCEFLRVLFILIRCLRMLRTLKCLITHKIYALKRNLNSSKMQKKNTLITKVKQIFFENLNQKSVVNPREEPLRIICVYFLVTNAVSPCKLDLKKFSLKKNLIYISTCHAWYGKTCECSQVMRRTKVLAVDFVLVELISTTTCIYVCTCCMEKRQRNIGGRFFSFSTWFWAWNSRID